MKVTYQDKELIESSRFISLGNGETVISLEYRNDKMVFILNFEDTPKDPQSVKFETVDNQTMRITMINWNQPLGTTFTELFKVGILGGKELFIILFVSKAGAVGTFRNVTFSAYSGKDI